MNRGPRHNGAFSLIEVAIAIGVLALVIFGVVGLVPMGMKAFRNSNEQSGAANLLNALSDSIRSAVTTDGTNFSWIFNAETNTYTIAGPVITKRWLGTNALNMQGGAETSGGIINLNKQLLAVVIVTPPSSLTSEGSALISVAWPAASGAVWSSTTLQWSQVESSSTLGIRFLPRLPLSLP